MAVNVERRIARLEADLAELIEYVRNLRGRVRMAEDDSPLRHVQVRWTAYRGGGEALVGQVWDQLDGFGDLALGDRVIVETQYGPRSAVVVGTEQRRVQTDYSGPLSPIQQRWSRGAVPF